MKPDSRERGSAMVETAITIPLLLMMMVGIFEVGRAYETWQVLTNAAREGARMAVTPSSKTTITTALIRQYMADGQLGNSGDRDGRRRQDRDDQCGRHPRQRVARDRRLSVRVHHAAAGGEAGRARRHGRRTAHHARDIDYAQRSSIEKEALMNRVRIFTVFLIALVAGGGLAYGTYDYLQNVPVKTVTVPTRRVVVANADLSLGSELRPDDLKAVDWPASSVPEGAFDDPAKLLGRGLIASVVRHEPILPGKLASKEAGSGLPPIIPPGKRAMSVRVNEVIGVAGYVLPGTRVDVVATHNPTNRAEDMTSKVVLSNVEVLTAGTRLEHDTQGRQAGASDGRHARRDARSSRAADARQHRGQDSARAAESPGSRISGNCGREARHAHGQRSPETGTGPHVVGRRRPSAPVYAQPAPTVEIIRGDKRTHVTVG